MESEKTEISSIGKEQVSKFSDYVALTKFRLASLVVFSATAGYAMAPGVFNWQEFLYLIVGGFLVTGSSNGFNQIIERDLDKKMNRTKNRPLPAGRMSVTEALVVSIVFGVVGLGLLLLIHPSSFILGLLALVSYVAIYTPLKRITPLSVLVGAFPGSVPPMLGYVAASKTFGLEPGILFLVQFFWQFPHFWAIAWKASKDYAGAGFKMLPLSDTPNKQTAWLILLFTMFMLPVSLLPWAFEMTKGSLTIIIATLATLAFTWPAYKLYKSCDVKDATTLMFVSFFYLPVLQIAYIIDKV